MVEVVRMMVAMLWKKRVPLGRWNWGDQLLLPRIEMFIAALTMKAETTIASVDDAMTAKTAHNQSLPPGVM